MTTDRRNEGLLQRTARLERVLADLLKISEQELVSLLTSRPVRISGKAGDVLDPVTDLDETIENRLREVLTKRHPQAGFLGEETFTSMGGSTGESFLVDPIDGTLNFGLGAGPYATSICYFEDGIPCVGLVHEAISNRRFWAVAGQGAFRDGEQIRMGASASPICLSSGFLRASLRIDPSIPQGLLGHRGKLRLLGSQALHLCYLAQGSLSLVVSLEAKVWDDAAGWLIAREAGAVHSLVFDGELFPVKPRSRAARGQSIFSMAGSADDVEKLGAALRAAGDADTWFSS